ncbi:apses-domain-containing protein, partial [Polychaeton citri CBS 116435]
MEVGGVACMRRRNDGWLNATQILKIAGVDKGKRTKVLEKEILTGEHEKVQGGYGKYQGTWISYRRGREFCRQYGVEDVLRPLLDYDISADGSGGQGQGQDTPTKEQAMAANRKRYYNQSLDAGRPTGNGPLTNGGTFFQNISPTTSVALAAMNKAARLNSPAPRPGSAQRSQGMGRPPQQDGLPQGSQQSIMSTDSFSNDARYDSGYGTQPAATGEPPRKRLKSDSHYESSMPPPGLPMDASMRSATPTEPNESFYFDPQIDTSQHEPVINHNGEPVAAPPLPAATSEEHLEKINTILDLFADPARQDFTGHPALTQLSGEDLNMPLDNSANNALHWAATLAKVNLLKLLIQRGANIWRGNSAGYTPLISAVIVNNCWEFSCFPDILELLGPLLEVRDLRGQTILHHIATNSGVKGRSPSSKYYLEALLEFLVRVGTQPQAGGVRDSESAVSKAAAMATEMANQTNGISSNGSSQESQGGQPISKDPVSLVRFLSHIVNARDKAGNTALNLVARIGNRSIIQQLLEIHADPNLPNHKGVSAKDFGVTGVDAGSSHTLTSGDVHMNGNTQDSSMRCSQSVAGHAQAADSTPAGATEEVANSSPKIEDLGKEVIDELTAMLTQNLSSHKETLKSRVQQIDLLNEQIREFSALQKQELERLQEAQRRVKNREEKRNKITRLRRIVAERRSTLHSHEHVQHGLGTADEIACPHQSFETVPLQVLRARLSAYEINNHNLERQKEELHSRSAELENLYRKVVSICTGYSEDEVETNLEALMAAVDSEQGALGEADVGRVRDFLRKVGG